MFRWLERWLEGLERPHARRGQSNSGDTSRDSSIFDVSSGSSSESRFDPSNADPSSFDSGFDGGASGGAGASSDFGGDSGGDSGGDGGGGDGGGGGD